VKTSKFEDQYTKLFNLAVWPEEPPEIRLFETFWNFGFPNIVENYVSRKCPKSMSLDSGHLD